MALALIGCTNAPTLSPSAGASAASVSAEPSPTPSASPSEPNVELSWTAEPFDGQIHAVIEDGGQLVAVGRDEAGLASWTSTDGATWARHDVPDPTFIKDLIDDFGVALYGGTRMGPMTRLGDTLFSFGTWYGPNDAYRPVGWRSADGTSWEFIESQSEFYTYGALSDAATAGDTLLAARATGLIGPIYSLWTWTAETSWRESRVRSTDDATITVLDAAVDDAEILAVGEVARRRDTPQDHWPRQPIGWQSDDAEHWHDVALPDDMESAIRIARAPGGGFSILGKGVVGTASIWFTPDGSEWAATDLGACLTAKVCEIGGLARAGEWLVATFRTGRRGTIWLSRDGANWIRQQTPRMAFADGQIAALGGELFVFVNGGSPDEPQTILLHGEPGS